MCKKCNDTQTSHDNDSEESTLGYIEFLPKAGISNAEIGNWWLQNVDNLIGEKNWDYTDEQIDKIFSTELNGDFRKDPLEGHLLKEHIKKSTNFMSCFTIVTLDDVNAVNDKTLMLNDDFINDMCKTGMNNNNKGFIFIPKKFITPFVKALHNATITMNLTDGLNIKRSDLYFRKVSYLTNECYKEKAIEQENYLNEKSISLKDGMTVEQANKESVLNEYLTSLDFAVTFKTKKYSLQREARMGINFTNSYGHQNSNNEYIKLHSDAIVDMMTIGNSFSDLRNLSIKIK